MNKNFWWFRAITGGSNATNRPSDLVRIAEHMRQEAVKQKDAPVSKPDKAKTG